MGANLKSPKADRAVETLERRMAGIGMSIAAEPDWSAEIESTLFDASVAGMDEGDLRLLSLLTTWFGVHHARVNADRLVRLVLGTESRRVRAYWAAVARWRSKDRRFARLSQGYRGPPLDLLPVGTEFQIQRRGEDERFVGSPLRVPAGSLRDRASDVLSPEVMVRRHAGYRNRVRIGSTYRADVWTVLEREPELSTTAVARRAHCSYAAAWQATQDFRLIEESGHRSILATDIGRR